MFEGKDNVFAKRLRSLMDDSKTTRETLSKYLGTTRQVVSQYISGLALPNIEKLNKMCSYFNVSSDYLLGRTSSKSSDTAKPPVLQDTTGLSDNAIQCLKCFYVGFPNELFPMPYNIDAINYILSNRDLLRDFLNRLFACWGDIHRDEELAKRTKKNTVSDETDQAVYLFTRFIKQKLVDNGYIDFYKPTVLNNKQKPGPKRKLISDSISIDEKDIREGTTNGND